MLPVAQSVCFGSQARSGYGWRLTQHETGTVSRGEWLKESMVDCGKRLLLQWSQMSSVDYQGRKHLPFRRAFDNKQ